MEVTKVFFRKYQSGKLAGFADVEFDHSMKAKGFKVFEGRDGGYFVAAPSIKDEKKKSDDGKDIYHDVLEIDRTKENGKELMGRITSAILAEMKDQKSQPQKKPISKTPSPDEIAEEDIPF